ncbi:MAG TPA: PAS domain S-box protein, partial [Thermoanaerobaculia bacterium]
MPHNYKQIVDAAPDAILVVAKGRFLFANAAAAALAGVPDPAALLDRHVFDLVPGESRAQILRLMAQHDSHPGTMSAIETKMLRVDGTIRDIEVMARPIVYGGSSAFYEGSSASVVFVCDISGRKRAEHELRTSEDRYRQIVESMNEALVVYDPAATIKFVNRQFCELFGYRPEDVIGKPATAVYAPETRVLVEEGIERRRRGLHDRYAAELTGISGKSVFVQVSAAPLVHDGEFAGSMALITDMSERTIAQEKLRKSEQRYQEIVDSSPNYIFSFDCEDRYLAANIAARERIGLSEEEMIGRTLEEVGIPAETAEEWKAQHALVRSTRQTRTLETIAAFPIGGPRILRRTVSPIFSETGAVIGVSGWSTDITEQKISEEKTQKLLRAIEEM